MSPLMLKQLQQIKASGEPLAALTAYDASFAALLERNGVEILLVGDSLGTVVQGHPSTLPVTLADILYHLQCVMRGRERAFVMADLPFGTYQVSPEQAFHSSAALMAAGANCVKLEGGHLMSETVSFLTSRGIPVCGHLGLTPQSVHQLGGYHKQGTTEAAKRRLKEEALALETAGASFLVLEHIPHDLAAEITQALTHTIVIGIGAGPSCHGQILVTYDLLGLTPPPAPSFAKYFANQSLSPEATVAAYVQAVKSRIFPLGG